MLMNNNDKNNRIITTSNKTYKKTNYLYTQPKIFNLINACRNKGLKFGLYTLFIPLFFFDFYKEYIATIDIILLCSLVILNYVIRPAVNNNYITKVSDHTDFKVAVLTKTTIIMISSIYRLLFATISEIGNMYYYNRDCNFIFDSTIALITTIISIIIIAMFIFPRNLSVVEYHKKMSLNYYNEIDKENNKNRINNYHNELRNKYKAPKYNSTLRSIDGTSGQNSVKHNTMNTNNKQTKNETGTPVKKSDRRRRIF